MYKIVEKRRLNDEVTLMRVEAPYAARRAKPGQFVMLRVDENGERIPLTIAGYDREAGTITVIFQKVGASTRLMDQLEEGECLQDFAGPLGKPSETEGYKKAAVIGGGLGVAIAFPQAKALHDAGVEVDLIVGFRNEGLIILKDELIAACDDLTIMTDDGSNGHKGFVTQALQEKLEAGNTYDVVIAIGPLMMMKAVAEMTRPYHIKTIVSLNSIMIDGTGMCGGCRLNGGRARPSLPAWTARILTGIEVDFDSALTRGRLSMYDNMQLAKETHLCKLDGNALMRKEYEPTCKRTRLKCPSRTRKRRGLQLPAKSRIGLYATRWPMDRRPKRCLELQEQALCGRVPGKRGASPSLSPCVKDGKFEDAYRKILTADQQPARHLRQGLPPGDAVRGKMRARHQGRERLPLCRLERFAADWAMAERQDLRGLQGIRARQRGQKVAVIGSGPCRPLPVPADACARWATM